MEDWQHEDYIFVVHNALEVYHTEYLVAEREFKRATDEYERRKDTIKTFCRWRGLSEEEIEQLFKDY